MRSGVDTLIKMAAFLILSCSILTMKGALFMVSFIIGHAQINAIVPPVSPVNDETAARVDTGSNRTVRVP
jgi:hypothetical protein